jgi:hypothetical protein
MLPLYKSPKVKILLPFEHKLRPWLLTAVIALATGFTSFSQELVFRNPALIPGSPAAGTNGATYRFSNVRSGIDALVKIKGRSGSDVVLQDIDVSNTGWDKAFQPQLGVNGNILGIKNWWMEFELSFVKAGTDQKAQVDKFNITALDIDGDGLTIREYVEFYRARGCILESVTQLLMQTISGGGNDDDDDDDDDDDNNGPGDKDYRMTGPILNFLNIDTAGTLVMATSRFEKKDKIKFRIGGKATGLGTSNAGMRFNSLWFRSFSYTAPQRLPVTLINFNAGLANKKVVLTWSTAQEKNSSHFVVQRSTDGVEYTDAGMIFTQGDSEIARTYNFQDGVSTNTKGVLYYRLKMVDLDGKFEHSLVRLVKLGETGSKLELQAFPNPVVTELRITIPESWQNKPVIYEVYTSSGQLVKTLMNKHATQTEIINMQFYQPGSYIIKAYNDKELAIQRVVKRR